ncbi:MAG: ion transporter [Litoreibacter sp.]|uniref:ion transporter n=1 Tax=Litoreibacter sp. TaxID=1969459 RepID=UPI003297A3EC
MKQFRQIAHKALDPDQKSDWQDRYLDLFLIALIAINVLAVILETVDSLDARFRTSFLVLEVVSMIIFSLEYIVRVWACAEDPKYKNSPHPRLSYMCSPMAIIDLLTIAPFYLGFILKIDLRFLRVLRLLRILKLTRYSLAMSMLIDVFKEEAEALIAGLFILFVLLVLASSGAYLAEHDAQPEKFGSIPAAMWWAIATLTTVGYGDVSPVTPAGQIFGSLVAVIGIGMAALPAGILASGLADRLHRTREEFADKLQVIWDRNIDASEKERLFDELRSELGVRERVASKVKESLKNSQAATASVFCPHCGEKVCN